MNFWTKGVSLFPLQKQESYRHDLKSSLKTGLGS